MPYRAGTPKSGSEETKEINEEKSTNLTSRFLEFFNLKAHDEEEKPRMSIQPPQDNDPPNEISPSPKKKKVNELIDIDEETRSE